MKKLLSTLCLLGIMTCVFAQSRKFKDERRVYLWDVTLSMKGYPYDGSVPDIYDQVVKDLENDIYGIDDENTELVVLPFQEGILETWREKATKAGKAKLVRKIKEYNNERVTRTNIFTPLKDVMSKILKPDKRNVLYLMTDGAHNMKSPTKEDLYRLLDGWCEFAKANDVYAFYIMLTNMADDKKVVNIIESQCNFEVERGTGNEFILIRPKESRISYNIKSDELEGFSVFRHIFNTEDYPYLDKEYASANNLLPVLDTKAEPFCQVRSSAHVKPQARFLFIHTDSEERTAWMNEYPCHFSSTPISEDIESVFKIIEVRLQPLSVDEVLV